MFKKLVLFIVLSVSVSAYASEFKFFKALAKSKQYALTYVFSAQCPHCQRMTAVIEKVKDQYNIDVFSIAQNGIGLGEFQNAIPLTKEIAAKYFPNDQIMFPFIALQELNGDMSVYSVGVGETTINKLLTLLDKYSKNILLGESESISETYQIQGDAK